MSSQEDWAAVALVGKEVWDRELNVYPLEPEGPTLLNFRGSYGSGYWVTETLTPGGAWYELEQFDTHPRPVGAEADARYRRVQPGLGGVPLVHLSPSSL